MARSWIDTPYRHQGRSRRGVDCAGPLVLIAQAIGIGDQFNDQLIYSTNPETFSLKQQMDSVLAQIGKDEIRPADVLLFKIDVHPQHVAIVTDYKNGGLAMVHCYSRIKRVTEHRLAQIWLSRLVQAYRIPGILEDI
ncbi:MAG: C40 family peptidase [Bacteroidota bacterium]